MSDLVQVEHDPFAPQLVPVNHDPFGDANSPDMIAANRIAQGSQWTGGLSKFFGTLGSGLWDQITLPSRPSVPPPAGLMQDDAGRLTVNGQPAEQSPEGAAFVADQQARNEWAPSMALGMLGGGSPFAVRGAAGIFGGRLAATADHSALDLAQKMTEQGIDRQQIWDATGWFTGADNKWRFEIPDDRLTVSAGDGHGIAGPESTIQHPDLAKAYGPLNDTVHDITDQATRGRGSYSSAHDLIEVEAPNLAQARSTTAHELQHKVQNLEGFVRGGDPDDLRSLGAAMLAKRGQSVPDANMRAAAYEAYRRLAGEVEARNVQARLGMTADQRRATPPWATEDVPAEKQIVRRLVPVEHNPFAE